MHREGIDGYVRLSPHFEVGQALVKGSTVSRTLAIPSPELTVQRQIVAYRLNLGGRNRIDSGKPIRVLLGMSLVEAVEEHDVSDEWWNSSLVTETDSR